MVVSPVFTSNDTPVDSLRPAVVLSQIGHDESVPLPEGNLWGRDSISTHLIPHTPD